MTVKELIKELKKLDENMEVEIENRSLSGWDNREGLPTWEGGGSRSAWKVVVEKSEYSDRNYVVIK